MENLPTVESLPFDWFVLLLRVIFIFLIYFFLYQVARVVTRELLTLGTIAPRSGPPPGPVGPGGGRLVVVDGGESELMPGVAFGLNGVATVGRHPDASIVVDDSFVSGQHAELSFEQGRWWVRDLGSTNGTFVNGRPVSVPTGVKSGDVVQFGRVKVQFVS